MVAGVAHEINTPIGIGVTAASTLAEKTRTISRLYDEGAMRRSDFAKYLAAAKQSTDILLSNLQRGAELISSFKQVAVDQSSEQRRAFAIQGYLQEILLSLRPKLKRTKHTIDIRCDGDLMLESYPGAFSQIVTNLVMNSLIHAFEPDDEGNIVFDIRRTPGRRRRGDRHRLQRRRRGDSGRELGPRVRAVLLDQTRSGRQRPGYACGLQPGHPAARGNDPLRQRGRQGHPLCHRNACVRPVGQAHHGQSDAR